MVKTIQVGGYEIEKPPKQIAHPFPCTEATSRCPFMKFSCEHAMYYCCVCNSWATEMHVESNNHVTRAVWAYCYLWKIANGTEVPKPVVESQAEASDVEFDTTNRWSWQSDWSTPSWSADRWQKRKDHGSKDNGNDHWQKRKDNDFKTCKHLELEVATLRTVGEYL